MKAVPGILPTLLEMIYFFSTPTIDVEPINTRKAIVSIWKIVQLTDMYIC